jgi:hypothetical protein
MTTTQNIGRWLIIGVALSTAILSFVAIVFGRDAATEVAADTGYGIGVALGAGWPVAVLVVVVAAVLVIALGSRDDDDTLRGDIDIPVVSVKHHAGQPRVYINGIEWVEGKPNYPLIAQLEKDLLAPRTPADWVAEAEAAAEVGLAVASPDASRPRVQTTRSVTWSTAWRVRGERQGLEQ